MEEKRMYLQSTIELTLMLEAEKFYKLLDKVYNRSEHCDGNKLVDQTLAPKGVVVTYHDKQYKKKVQLTVNLNVLLDGDAPDKDNATKLLHKLEKRVNSYFGSAYTLDDFNISKIYLGVDIDVGGREKVAAYIKVLKRAGKVKGFSPSQDDRVSGIGFCLEGNSNGTQFMLFDLEGFFRERLKEADSECKELKSMAKNSAGLLRAEVRLIKSTAIRACADETLTTDQISMLCCKGQKIFLEVFQRIVPFGDFYKKHTAMEIIRKEITDAKTRRRMLRLVALVPEKKSLLLAQKALNYRKVDDVMEALAGIEVSPVTISKRNDVKHLKNLYAFI